MGVNNKRKQFSYTDIVLILQYMTLCHRPVFSLHVRPKSNHEQLRLQRFRNDENETILITKRITGYRGGGSSPIQPNPNFVDYNQFMPPTLGDEEKDHIRRNQYQQNADYRTNYPFQQQQQYRHQKLKPLSQVMKEFMVSLHRTSPTLFYGILSSIFIFFTWQIPSVANQILHKHFVCSYRNVMYHRHYHTLLTSAISHNSIGHLLMNLYGFYTFGRNVESTLKMNHLSLVTYCITSAIFSNLLFLLLTPKGSCIGLSGVTLSLLALDAKLHPSKEIGFVVRFIPIRLPAQYALTGLLIWSLVGVVSTSGGRSDGVAHSVHLGGLIYGVLLYELLKSGLYRKSMKFLNRAVYDWRRRLLRQ